MSYQFHLQHPYEIEYYQKLSRRVKNIGYLYLCASVSSYAYLIYYGHCLDKFYDNKLSEKQMSFLFRKLGMNFSGKYYTPTRVAYRRVVKLFIPFCFINSIIMLEIAEAINRPCDNR